MKQRAIFSNEKLIDKLTNSEYTRPIKLEEKLIETLVKAKPLLTTPTIIPVDTVVVNKALGEQTVTVKEVAPELKEKKQNKDSLQKAEHKEVNQKLILLKSIAANLIELGLIGVITDEENVTLSVLTLEDIKALLFLMEQSGSFSCETPYGMVEFCKLVYKAAGKKEMSEQLEDALLTKYKRASNLDFLHDFLNDVSEEVAILALKKNTTLELILIEALNAGDQELANEIIDMLGAD